MEIDIRQLNSDAAIDTIRLADANSSTYVADVIEYDPTDLNCKVGLTDSDSDRSVGVMNKAHAENLIKGLQKAIQLGWFD